MKTITECQPLIYGLLMAQAEHRKVRQRKNAQRLAAAMPVLYMVIGLAIVFDARLMPWDIRFWLIFSPFFLLGEQVLLAVVQANRCRQADEGGKSASAVDAEPSYANGKIAEGQKRRISAKRNRSPALLLSAFQVRARTVQAPLVQPQKFTSKSARAGIDGFSSSSRVVLARAN
jgi:hypothetical protein